MSIYHEIDGETARAIEKHREDAIQRFAATDRHADILAILVEEVGEVAEEIDRLAKMCDARNTEIDRLRAELAVATGLIRATEGSSTQNLTRAKKAEAAIARIQAVITDHDCCNCLVRADGCEHMWNEMREVFRPALDGGTE